MSRQLVRVRYRFTDGGAKAATRKARNALRRDMGKVLKEASTAALVPPAKRMAPHVEGARIVAFGTASSAGLTIRGRGEIRNIVGYLEHGGTIHGRREVVRTGNSKHGRRYGVKRSPLVFTGADGTKVFVTKVSRARVPEGRYMGYVVRQRRYGRRLMYEVKRGLPPILAKHLGAVAKVGEPAGAGL